jgi:hypothetical protein
MKQRSSLTVNREFLMLFPLRRRTWPAAFEHRLLSSNARPGNSIKNWPSHRLAQTAFRLFALPISCMLFPAASFSSLKSALIYIEK